MNEPICFGQETELAVVAHGPNGSLLSPEHSADILFSTAVETLPHLPSGRQGLFLPTGGRFYRDTGDHPEMTTPEVVNPWQGVQYVRASERIVSGLARAARDRKKVRTMLVFKNGSNYGPEGGIAWGTHESYSLRKHPETHSQRSFESYLIPFLVSRIVISGSGGFDSLSQGIEFLISPRVAHLTCAVSGNSTSERPILHLRDESLSDLPDFGRLHLICGESNLGDLSLWLKFGTTAMVTSMICAGLPLPDHRLSDPVRAMKLFSRDWRTRRRTVTRCGKRVTAIDIQKGYLEAAEAAVGHPGMPIWTADACARWRSALERLENHPIHDSPVRRGPESLDWRGKHALFTELIQIRGFSWREVTAWNRVVVQMLRSIRNPEEPPPYLTPAWLASEDPRVHIALKAAGLISETLNRQWSRLAEFLRLRDDLQALDVRLMEVGPDSLFEELQRSGAIDLTVEGVEPAEDAVDRPPQGSRAAIRGSMIGRLHRAGMTSRFSASWEGIHDRLKNRRLDLGSPFESRIRWVKEKAASASPFDPQRLSLLFRVESGTPNFPSGAVLDRYDAGDYRGGWEIIQDYHHRFLESDEGAQAMALPYDYRRFRAWFAARLGLLDESIEALAQLRATRPGPSASERFAADHVLALLNLGLAGHDSIEDWIPPGAECVDGTSRYDAPFLSNAACRRLRTGATARARVLLDRALEPELFGASHSHTQSRILAHRGECRRRRGELEDAANWLRQSADKYLAGGFRGDYADFCLTYQAKLSLSRGDDGSAVDLLNEALAIQAELGNPGQIRTLLLLAQARRSASDAVRIEVEEKARNFPSLAACPRLRQLLDPSTWTDWCEGRVPEPLCHAV